MVSSGVLPSRYGKDGFSLPQSWQDQIVSKFERLEVQPFPEQASPAVYNRSPSTWHDRCLPKYNALLEVLECCTVHPSTNARIAEILLRKLKLALRPSSCLAPEEAHFIVGRGFSAYCRMGKGAGEVDSSLEPLLRAAAPQYARLPDFLEALLGYQASLKASPKYKHESKTKELASETEDLEAEYDLLVRSLVENLSSDSSQLRLLSLRLLEHINETDHGSNSEAISLMIMIEQTPLDLQSARSASMHIRKLASIYPHQTTIPWMKYAIPSFCFGMLTVKMAQIWDDTSAALKEISESKVGEEAVASLAFKWLETPSIRWSGSPKAAEKDQNNGLTDFECSNMIKLDQLAQDAASEVLNARDTMLRKFEVAQSLVGSQPTTARSQALRVLAAAPSIAERRSRQLIPMFLSWAGNIPDHRDVTGDDEESGPSDWTRRDQKGLLDILGLFVNPRSLFKSEEVYEALLRLLANGDIETQKSALKAILTWKDSSVKPYHENLSNLLDEARFKDEITVLLQGQTAIQPEHREALMPILLRLLYGRTISRKGAASGKQGLEARRLTVLRNLSTDDIGGFLDIALGDLRDLELIKDGMLQQYIFEKELLDARKQVGFMNMMEVVLKELGTKVESLVTKVLGAVLYCLVVASRQLRDEAPDDSDGDETTSQISLLKSARQTGLKCLVLLFNNAADFDWSPYVDVIVSEVVEPRLNNLPIETAQGVSGTLRLFFTWSSSSRTVLLLGSHPQILPKVAECLLPPKSKDEVKLFALSIIRGVVKCAKADTINSNSELIKKLLEPNMDHFLVQLGGVLRNHQDLSKDLLEGCVEAVSELAPFVSNSTQARNLVDVSVFLLDQPSRRVSPRTKAGLLLVLERFVPLYNLQNDAELKDRVYRTITSLFGFFKDKASREVLSHVLLVYSFTDPVLKEIAELCKDLNSFVEGRLDEPDYNRRLKAFNVINGNKDLNFTAHQWMPLLYNMLYYIKHEEEFGILSSNSSDGVCRFIDAASAAKGTSDFVPFENMLSGIVIPALFAGVREPSEIIRREYMKVMAHLIRLFPTWPEVSDMHGLLAGEDELESSFFNNILTAGKGRQSSALGRLEAAAEKRQLSSNNVSHFFIPLIEHFIFDRAEGNEAHSLAAEATTTVGILAGSLEWQQYRAMLRRFIGYLQSKQELEKQIIRLLGRVIDALTAAAQPRDDSEMQVDDQQEQSTLAKTIPKEMKLSEDLTSNILPPLMAYLHEKDESTVSLRVPIAVIIVRLLKLLPQDKMNERLPAVLTDVCHILRSKAQESRDMTRDTLVKICVILGPSCFGFVLKELRGALARGYQLHVLSYTMHSILVATTPEYAPGDLDYCLPSIVAIIMDDIFGVVGQEKDAEEYTSKTKEVKSSKSHDSMELIAKTATLSRLTDLVHPIRVLLKEKLNIRMVRKIDELLNRISNGLLKNPAAESRDSLIFCYEVIKDVYNSQKPQEKIKEDYKLKKYLLQKGAKKGGDRGATTFYTYKLIRFAFDVMRSVLKKHDKLRTASNLAGFIPMIGDAVVQAEEEIKVATFKLLTTIVKVPLKVASDGTNLYRIATAEAIKSVSTSSSTTSDIAQAALKLLSVVLRDRADVPVKERSIDDILGKLKDDMTEPERRHVTFNFLRAVLDSKVETAVVYDTLDYVGTVMVTNEDKDTRDLARGAYFQFLRDYPQKKSRWTKQLAFIVANLKYEREGGRLSILEVIHLLLSKSSHDFVQEVSATCFVPLIFVLVNDDSEKCRMAAGEVLKEIFKRADEERMTTFLTLLQSWIKQTQNTAVVRLALQAFGLYYEAQPTTNSTDVDMLLDSISDTISIANDANADWEIIYAALQLAGVLCQNFSEKMLSSNASALWSGVRMCLSYTHAWVKLSAARLISTYFTDFAKANAESGLQGLPLKGSHGLKLSGDIICELMRRITTMFKTPGLSELLAEQIVKDLIFLGRCAGANDLKWKASQKTDSGDEDVDEEVDREEPKSKTALQYLFGRLSFLLRRETSPPRAPALVPKTASLQLLSILCNKLEPETLVPSLETVLLATHNLTDPSIPMPYSTDEEFRNNYEALKTTSEELMETLKRKLGTQAYSEALLKVREGVKERRAARSGKRRIEAVSQPEKFGESKRKKLEKKKEKRKERGQEHSRRRNEW
ncbi:U3 snoRNP protein [Clarireedia jacksonii]